MEKKHQIGQPFGKAHIVRDNDAGLAEMLLENLDQIAKPTGGSS